MVSHNYGGLKWKSMLDSELTVPEYPLYLLCSPTRRRQLSVASPWKRGSPTPLLPPVAAGVPSGRQPRQRVVLYTEALVSCEWLCCGVEGVLENRGLWGRPQGYRRGAIHLRPNTWECCGANDTLALPGSVGGMAGRTSGDLEAGLC